MVSFRLRLARQYYSPGNLQLADLLDSSGGGGGASTGQGGCILGVGASRVVDARVRAGHGCRGRVVERRVHVGGQAEWGRRAGHRRVVAERRLRHGVVIDQQTPTVVGAHVLQMLKVDLVGNERFAGAASVKKVVRPHARPVVKPEVMVKPKYPETLPSNGGQAKRAQTS